MEIESKKEEEGEQWVALINYSDKKFGDKSLQIVSCEDIKNFDHRKFEDDMKKLELAKSTRKKLDPLEEEKMKFYYVAWINAHGEKIYKPAEVIAVRGSTAELEKLKAEKRPRKNPKRESLAIDVIEERDGEIEANVHTRKRENVDGNSIDDGKGAEESSSSDGGVDKALRQFNIHAAPSDTNSSSDEIRPSSLGERGERKYQKHGKRGKSYKASEPMPKFKKGKTKRVRSLSSSSENADEKKKPKPAPKVLKFKKRKRRHVKSLSSSTEDENESKVTKPVQKKTKGQTVRVVTSEDERVLQNVVQEFPKLDFGSVSNKQLSETTNESTPNTNVVDLLIVDSGFVNDCSPPGPIETGTTRQGSTKEDCEYVRNRSSSGTAAKFTPSSDGVDMTEVHSKSEKNSTSPGTTNKKTPEQDLKEKECGYMNKTASRATTNEATQSAKELELQKKIDFLMKRDDERERTFNEMMMKQIEKFTSMVFANQVNRAALTEEVQNIQRREMSSTCGEPLARKKLFDETERARDENDAERHSPVQLSQDNDSLIGLEDGHDVFEVVPTTSSRPTSEGLVKVNKRKEVSDNERTSKKARGSGNNSDFEDNHERKSKKHRKSKKKKYRKSKKAKKEKKKKGKKRKFGEFTEKELEKFKAEEKGRAPMAIYDEINPETNKAVPTFHMHNGVCMDPKTWENLQENIGTAFFRALINVVWPTREMGNRAVAPSRAQLHIYNRSPRKEFTPRKVACVKDVYFEHVDNLPIKPKKKKKLKAQWSTVLSSAMSAAHHKLYLEGEAKRREDGGGETSISETSSSSGSSSSGSESDASSDESE
ncbi:hypothetical protein QAD02_016571 [Eretmocerus hayati]|uniref:Uncharacterized protein n=1 Tax=Eretmocerus hayati TaxID=131215 RepID=A0ACC2PB09_9HYME|nr:hypothetical protein QAD02_016571 [Eretmocerus hayati]